jgi:hypothetical protein
LFVDFEAKSEQKRLRKNKIVADGLHTANTKYSHELSKWRERATCAC